MKLGGKADACFNALTKKHDLSSNSPQRKQKINTFRRTRRIRDVHALHAGHDLLSLRLAVRLRDGQPHRRRPHHRRHLVLGNRPRTGIADGSGSQNLLGQRRVALRRYAFGGDRFRDEPRTLGEPELDVSSAGEKVADRSHNLGYKLIGTFR